jgi:hypothetical protein
LILNVVVGALVASHESDQVKVPPNHAVVGKINGCIDVYAGKWLLHQHLDGQQTRALHEVGKYVHTSTHVGGPRQQNHHVINVRILNNPHARQK